MSGIWVLPEKFICYRRDVLGGGYDDLKCLKMAVCKENSELIVCALEASCG